MPCPQCGTSHGTSSCTAFSVGGGVTELSAWPLPNLFRSLLWLPSPIGAIRPPLLILGHTDPRVPIDEYRESQQVVPTQGRCLTWAKSASPGRCQQDRVTPSSLGTKAIYELGPGFLRRFCTLLWLSPSVQHPLQRLPQGRALATPRVFSRTFCHGAALPAGRIAWAEAAHASRRGQPHRRFPRAPELRRCPSCSECPVPPAPRSLALGSSMFAASSAALSRCRPRSSRKVPRRGRSRCAGRGRGGAPALNAERR